MVDRRQKNMNWAPADEEGKVPTWERVNLAVLMDIRDELQTLNQLLSCPNFVGIPRTLEKIRLRLPVKRRRKAR